LVKKKSKNNKKDAKQKNYLQFNNDIKWPKKTYKINIFIPRGPRTEFMYTRTLSLTCQKKKTACHQNPGPGDKWMLMNRKRFGRKRSWRNLRYYDGIRLEGQRKTTKTPNQHSRLPGSRFEPGTSRIRNSSFNHSTTADSTSKP
jgi:hypothetical protein